MYKIDNLTNRDFRFQGVIIRAYSSEKFAQITDYISLSRLANSGKIRYYSIPNTVEKAVEIVETKVEEPVIETKTVVEVVEDVKEEKAEIEEPEKTFEDIKTEDVSVDNSTEEKTAKRKNRKADNK